MPVKITKIGEGMARVATPHGVKSKHTTLAKAYAQKRLLMALEKNNSFIPNKNRR